VAWVPPVARLGTSLERTARQRKGLVGRFATFGLVDPLGRGWVFGEQVRRAGWAWCKAAAAVRAFAAQYRIYAARAKGAFKRADTGLQAVGWQVFVAAFTAGAELKHCGILLLWWKF
jgi:hypothetical protein